MTVPRAHGAWGAGGLPRRAARNRAAAEQDRRARRRTLAQLVRIGWYREARVKSWAAHAMRHLVGARVQLVGISIGLSNQIRRVLKTFGLRTGGRAGRVFEAKVREQVDGRPEAAGIVVPL